MQLLCTEVKDFLVQRPQVVQVRAIAQADCVAEHLFCSTEPCWAERGGVDVQLWGLVKQCVADELGFCTESARSSRFHDLLILVL